MSEQGPGGPGEQELYKPRHGSNERLEERIDPDFQPNLDAEQHRLVVTPEQVYYPEGLRVPLERKVSGGWQPEAQGHPEPTPDQPERPTEMSGPGGERSGPPLGEGRIETQVGSDEDRHGAGEMPPAAGAEAKQRRLHKIRAKIQQFSDRRHPRAEEANAVRESGPAVPVPGGERPEPPVGGEGADADHDAAGELPPQPGAESKRRTIVEIKARLKAVGEVADDMAMAGARRAGEIKRRGIPMAKEAGLRAKDAWVSETKQQAAELRGNWSQTGRNIKEEWDRRKELRKEQRRQRAEEHSYREPPGAPPDPIPRVGGEGGYDEGKKREEQAASLKQAEWQEVNTRLHDVYELLEHPISHSHHGEGDAAAVRLGVGLKGERLDAAAAAFRNGLGMMDEPVAEIKQKSGDVIKRYMSVGLQVGGQSVARRVAVEEVWVEKTGEHKVFAIVADQDVFKVEPWRKFSKKRPYDFSYAAERRSARGFNRNANAPEGVPLGTVADLPLSYYTGTTAMMAGVPGIRRETIMPELKIPTVPKGAEARDQKFARVNGLLDQVMELKEATPVTDYKWLAKRTLRKTRERALKRADEIAAELGLVRSYDGNVEAVQSPDMHVDSQAYVDRRNDISRKIQGVKEKEEDDNDDAKKH